VEDLSSGSRGRHVNSENSLVGCVGVERGDRLAVFWVEMVRSGRGKHGEWE
jgi:hypothetical protein